MVVSFMGINFGDAEGEEGEREKLEGIFEGGSVGDFGEERVLLAGFGICFRFQSSQGTFNCDDVLEDGRK